MRRPSGTLQAFCSRGRSAGPDAAELVGEGVGEEVDPVEVVGDLPASAELAAPSADGALGVSVVPGGPWRECPEGDAALLELLFELGPELRSAVDLDNPCPSGQGVESSIAGPRSVFGEGLAGLTDCRPPAGLPFGPCTGCPAGRERPEIELRVRKEKAAAPLGRGGLG